MGVKHKSYHHVNLFPVNSNFFTKIGDSIGDVIIDDSKKSISFVNFNDFNLQKDKNLLKEFSFMVIGFCQKWVDLYATQIQSMDRPLVFTNQCFK